MSLYRQTKKFTKPTAKQARTTAYGSDWAILSATCLKLAKYICRDCGGRESLIAHHIIPLSRGGTNALVNLKCLCRNCHKKYHKHLS